MITTARICYLMVVAQIVIIGCSESEIDPSAASTQDSPAKAESTDEKPGYEKRKVVKLTSAAVSKFKEVLADEPSKLIRLSVKHEGPTGFKYDLKVDSMINDADFGDDSHGFVILIDPKSSVYLEGTTIGWQMEPDGRAGFTFDNPNAVKLK